MSAEAITNALLSTDAALSSLVGERVFPVELPDMQPAPALVHNLGVGVPIGVIGGGGPKRSRVTLEAYAEDLDKAKAIFKAARDALLEQWGPVAGVDDVELIAVEEGSEGPNGWDPERKLIVCPGQVFMTWRET